jgi:hypothetical protein
VLTVRDNRDVVVASKSRDGLQRWVDYDLDFKRINSIATRISIKTTSMPARRENMIAKGCHTKP